MCSSRESREVRIQLLLEDCEVVICWASCTFDKLADVPGEYLHFSVEV